MQAPLAITLALGAAVALAGCSDADPSIPPHLPATFRADVQRLLSDHGYGAAAAFIESADPIAQADHDAAGYIAIAGYAVTLPGVDAADTDYDRARDWLVPGTSDVIEDARWQRVATAFAEQYNKRRASTSPAPR